MVIDDPLVHLASAGLLAWLLAAGGAQKLRNRPAFVEVLRRYGQAPRPRAVLSWLLPVMELLSAAGLLASGWLPWLAAPAAALLTLYALVLAHSVWRGKAIEDCGCHFGGKPQPPSPALVWRNLLLVGLTLNLLWPVAVRPLSWFDALTLAFLLIGAVVLYGLSHLLISNHAASRSL